ncbi:hypothetical protein RB195_006849 [Necator americanus]|uniref:Carbonic anhydrase n=1 Tax=Necator americanus TaxID=51031 RepID=A0ABR1BW80_NECAM
MVPEKLSLWIRLLIVFCEFWLVTAEHWNYENTNWNDLCEYGKRQSPVNLDLSKVVVTHERPLEFHHYDIEDHIEVTNNGHTEVVQGFQSWTERPYISGGGLHGIYYLQQFHFHWGTSDLTGSEHTLDLLHYPMEVHFVHILEGYNQTRTVGVPDAVVVISKRIHEYDGCMFTDILVLDFEKIHT